MTQPKFASISSSHVGALSGFSLKTMLEKARNDPQAKKLFWVGLAIGLVPFVGGVISYGVDRHRNTVIEKKQKQVLAGYYRNQVAMQLGVDPQSVGLNDLELAAKVNPMIAGAIKKVDQEKNSANRTAAMVAAGSTAAGFLLPGAGNAAATITEKVTEHAVKIGGGIAGGMAGSLFDKKELHVSDMVEHIDEKKVNGEKITTIDVALLHLAMDADLRKRFEERHKKSLHHMDANQQIQVLQQEPELLRTAEPIAEDLNEGRRDVQNVVISGFSAPLTFAQRVGRKAAPASYTQKITQERESAAPALSGPGA